MEKHTRQIYRNGPMLTMEKGKERVCNKRLDHMDNGSKDLNIV